MTPTPVHFHYFKNLRCAYTGAPLTVVMHVFNGIEMYYSMDAFDPRAPHATSEELWAALSFRDGIEGAATGLAALKCPYTGNIMRIVEVPQIGFRAEGGFSPLTPVAGSNQFARLAMMRNGVVPPEAPPDLSRTPATARPIEPKEIQEHINAFKDAADAIADRVVHETSEKKASIVVPEGKPTGKGAKRG